MNWEKLTCSQKSYFMSKYLYDIIYPSLSRMAEIKFGEQPKNKVLYEHSLDDQANRMLRYTIGIVWEPSRVFIKYLVADMLFKYISTGGMDISFNAIEKIDRMYWDIPLRPLSIRPERLLTY